MPTSSEQGAPLLDSRSEQEARQPPSSSGNTFDPVLKPALVVGALATVAGTVYATAQPDAPATYLRLSAVVILGTNVFGFLAAAVSRSSKAADITGLAYAGPLLSLWAVHIYAVREQHLHPFSWPPTKGLITALLATCWALRIQIFLARRAYKFGKDTRLDSMFAQPGEPFLTGPSRYPVKLLGFWLVHSLWEWAILLPVTSSQSFSRTWPLFWLEWVFVVLFLCALALESVADYQKSVVKAEGGSQARFMHTGVWAWCQFPNYAGEIGLWAAMWALCCAPHFWLRLWWTALSPVLTALLLIYISGVNLQVQKTDERCAGNEAYRDYRTSTSLLIPWPTNWRA